MKEPNTNEVLPAELLWAEGEHASDVVLAALADGQVSIVPAVVRAHVAQCPVCVANLGHSALLSLETHRSLAGARPVARRPVPRVAVVLGLVAAAVGLVPWLLQPDAGEAPTRVLSTVTRTLAAFSTRLDATGRSTLGIAITYVAATALVIAGLALARLSPKKEVSS